MRLTFVPISHGKKCLAIDVKNVGIINIREGGKGKLLRNIEVRAGSQEVEKSAEGSSPITVNTVCGYFKGPGADGGEYFISCYQVIPGANFITIQIIPPASEQSSAQMNTLCINEVYINWGVTVTASTVADDNWEKFGTQYVLDRIITRDNFFKSRAEPAPWLQIQSPIPLRVSNLSFWGRLIRLNSSKPNMHRLV